VGPSRWHSRQLLYRKGLFRVNIDIPGASTPPTDHSVDCDVLLVSSMCSVRALADAVIVLDDLQLLGDGSIIHSTSLDTK